METNGLEGTIPDLFILESLTEEDVLMGRREGEKIADILRIAGKDPKYYYFTDFAELEHLIALFEMSGYRYLHFSSHANNQNISSTNESIHYDDFAEYFKNKLNRRRLFFSACAIGNRNFVDSISRSNPQIHSIMAPSVNIEFSHAIATWSAFYLSMFSRNPRAMKKSDIIKTIELFCELFPYEFFYASHNITSNKWKYHSFQKKL